MDIARGFAIDWYSIKINKQVYYVSFTIASGCIVESQVFNTKDIWTLGLYFNTNGFFKRTLSMTEHRLPKSPFIAAVNVSLEAYHPGVCHLWQKQFQYTGVVLLPSYPWQLFFFSRIF